MHGQRNIMLLIFRVNFININNAYKVKTNLSQGQLVISETYCGT